MTTNPRADVTLLLDEMEDESGNEFAAQRDLPALLAAVRAGLALADEMERRVAPRSFHPAGTHTDGRSQAFAEAAAELRHALTAPLGHGDTEESDR